MNRRPVIRGRRPQCTTSQRVPAPSLSEFIERFWQCSDHPSHSRERILPSGTFELVVNLHEDEIRIYDPLHPDHFERFWGAVVSGTYSRNFLIDPKAAAQTESPPRRPLLRKQPA